LFWENWISKCKGLKLNPLLLLWTKINLECIKALSIRLETTTGNYLKLKVLELFSEKESNHPGNKSKN
jgi:hypothetical protein